MKIELYPFEVDDAIREFINRKYSIDMDSYTGCEVYANIEFDNTNDKIEYIETRDDDKSLTIGFGGSCCHNAATTFEIYLGDLKKVETIKPVVIAKKKVTKKKVTKKKK